MRQFYNMVAILCSLVFLLACQPNGTKNARKTAADPAMVNATAPRPVVDTVAWALVDTEAAIRDYALFQANDSTWQLWLLLSDKIVRYQADRLTDSLWQNAGTVYQHLDTLVAAPMAISNFDVLKTDTGYVVFYSLDGKTADDYEGQQVYAIESSDGLTFEEPTSSRKVMQHKGRSTLVDYFNHVFYLYYRVDTSLYCQVAANLHQWSEPKAVSHFGDKGNFEILSIVRRHRNYLFIAANQKVELYASKDRMNFGLTDNRYYMNNFDYSLPQVIAGDKGQDYICFEEGNKLKISKLNWLVNDQ